METENDTKKMMQDKMEYYAAEARFVYLRDATDSALEDGKSPDEAYTGFLNLSSEEQSRWIEVAKHLNSLFCQFCAEIVNRA
ncbi:hypothetical protein [Akkermansia glycaniphila]|uniref:Uncharacterized protein n=1 Tax=Akkermansia glycaniphila TaxID=1679444 RepID=A0A1C7P9Q4_9BACT|nr:hypothetical protein [Akkermansia glycaniphila]OCA02293.1 hypothetical protein AC781_10705 [Akkermansia glycaniphila]SEH87256.1 Hypothetical protein PYTT_1357 [Akkermansia glycaniphila]